MEGHGRIIATPLRRLIPIALGLGLGLIPPGSLAAEPPFSTTSRLEPEIIVSQDPGTFSGIARNGRGQRMVFDRRTGSTISMMAYLLEARFENLNRAIEFQVNPEFGRAGSLQQAKRYAREIGRLPQVLLSGIRTVVIHRGDQPLGGSEGNVLIHTARAQKRDRAGFLEETLVHEATHASLDSDHKNQPDWKAAQRQDGRFITPYAQKYPDREDIASSFIMWMAVRFLPNRLTPAQVATVKGAIPNRLAYFDRQNFAMEPVARRVFDPTTEPPFTSITRLSSRVITDETPNALQVVSYSGQGQRTAFDGRLDQTISMEAHLFEARYAGGNRIEFQVNPEFTRSAAEIAAERYARVLGHLPGVLRSRFTRVAVHLGERGSQLRDGTLVIHANRAFQRWQKGLYAESLAHISARSLATGHTPTPGWASARELDASAVSDRAGSSVEQDFAESFLAWMLVQGDAHDLADAELKAISDTIPARINYLERQGFWMSGEAPAPEDKDSDKAGEPDSEQASDEAGNEFSGGGGSLPLLLTATILLRRSRSFHQRLERIRGRTFGSDEERSL